MAPNGFVQIYGPDIGRYLNLWKSETTDIENLDALDVVRDPLFRCHSRWNDILMLTVLPWICGVICLSNPHTFQLKRSTVVVGIHILLITCARAAFLVDTKQTFAGRILMLFCLHPHLHK